MQKISLYIQPQIGLDLSENTTEFVNTDLMEEELITVTQVIKDLRNLDQLYTDYSRSFNLPASKTNNKIFKSWYNADVNQFDSNVYCNARIFLNHLSFREGKIKLNSVTMKNQKPFIYKVTFFGNTSTLKEVLKQDEISDLTWLNEFNHTATNTSVRNSLTSGQNFTVDGIAYNKAVVYPLLAHSQAYLYNQTGDFDNGMNIAITAQDNSKRGVLAEDLKPAIKVSLIIKAIEEKYGLTFKTGNFFQSNVFDNFYMWLHREKGKMPLAGTWVGNVNQTYTGSGDVTELTNAPSSVFGYFSTGTGIWFLRMTNYSNVIYSGNSFRITVTITPTSGTSTARYDLQILDARNWRVISAENNLSGTSSVVYEIGYGTSDFIDDYENTFGGSFYDQRAVVPRLISQDAIQFRSIIKIERIYGYENDSGTVVDENLTATFTSVSTTISPQDALVTITDQTPKMKVKDFLSGLFKQFNLIAYIDELTEEIIVQTLDNYYALGNQVDISKYVIVDEHEVDEVMPFGEIDLEYLPPKSILAQQYEQTNNKAFGSATHTVETDSTETFKIKSPFEHMMFEGLDERDTGERTSLVTGTFLNQDLKPSIGAPLLMFINPLSIGTTNTINFVDSTRTSDVLGAEVPSGVRYTLSDYHRPDNYNELGTATTPPEHNLNFGSEINEILRTDYGGNNNSLFQKYFQNYITRVFSKKARLLKIEAVFPVSILSKLKLNDLIVLGTTAYTINKMSTKLQSGRTSLELLSEPVYDVTSDTISMTYSGTSFCQNVSDPVPTFSPSGGTFTTT